MGDDDEKMGDASLPPSPSAPPAPRADWAADVEHEHEASGRNADVLELEREKARKRAERFGQAFKEPSKKTLAGAHGLLSRKEVLAVRKERAMKKAARGGQFVTGIDLFDPEEEAKRAARAAKFGAMLDAAPEQRALAERRSAERAARGARVRAGGDADASMDAGAEAQDTLEDRVDPELDAVWRNDAVHLYGVDHMTTQRLRGLFRGVRARVLRVDQRQLVQRGVRGRGDGAPRHSHEGYRDGRGGEPGREGGAAGRSGGGDAVALRSRILQGRPKTLQLSFASPPRTTSSPTARSRADTSGSAVKAVRENDAAAVVAAIAAATEGAGNEDAEAAEVECEASTTTTRAWAIYAINSSAPARKRRRRAKRRDRRVATVTRRCASTTPARTPWTRRTRTRRQRRPLAG